MFAGYEAPAWPLRTPHVVCALSSPWAALGPFRTAVASGTPASATGPTAATAIYVPFVVTTRATFTRGFWMNGSVATNAGNACVGIYDEAGNRLATTGNVAASGNSVIQHASFTAAVTLDPGRYYMAISFSASGVNSTTAASTATAWRISGCFIQATANPLPSPATFATWATQPIPLFGISQDSFV